MDEEEEEEEEEAITAPMNGVDEVDLKAING